MGIFSRNKFDKIKRSEVVDAIIQLEKQESDIMVAFDESKSAIQALVERGKRETDRNMQVAYARKISNIQKENSAAAKRLQFVNSNLSAMYGLKNAMDDKEFINNNSKISLNDMLGKPQELEKFLNKVNIKKIAHEDNLASSLEVFENASESYVENESIYGVTENMDNILAMFETDKASEDVRSFTGNVASENSATLKEEPIKTE